MCSEGQWETLLTYSLSVPVPHHARTTADGVIWKGKRRRGLRCPVLCCLHGPDTSPELQLTRRHFLSTLRVHVRTSEDLDGGVDTVGFVSLLEAVSSFAQACIPPEMVLALMGASVIVLVSNLLRASYFLGVIAGKKIGNGFRARVCAVPVRSVHQGGHRLRGTHCAQEHMRIRPSHS